VNVNPLIISALTSLSLPVYPNVYTGTANEYITFNYADERPVLRADDTDLCDETVVQVHYFTLDGSKVQGKKKSIRNLLRAAGFSIGPTQEFYESDTKLTHVIVTASIEGVIDDD